MREVPLYYEHGRLVCTPAMAASEQDLEGGHVHPIERERCVL